MMPATFALVHRSFNLHLQLKDMLDGEHRYDFRPMSSFGSCLEDSEDAEREGPAWLRKSVALESVEPTDLARLDQTALTAWCNAAGIPSTPEAIESCVISAQLQPCKFTEALVSYASAHYGLEVVTGPRGEVSRLSFHDGFKFLLDYLQHD